MKQAQGSLDKFSMKILIVSWFFPPTNAPGAIRVGALARHLVNTGHEVRVLAGRDPGCPQTLPVDLPEGVVTEVPLPFATRLRKGLAPLERQYRSGTMRHGDWLRILYKYFRTLFCIPDRYVGWCLRAIPAGREIVGAWKPDMIYASAMPVTSLLVAKGVAKSARIPWVAEMRDLWVDSHYYDMPAPRRWIDERIEESLLGHADALVTVSEPLADALRKRYRKPVATILNGIDLADVPAVESVARRADGPVEIIYTGLVYPKQRDPSLLFEALGSLGEARSDFRVVFYGNLMPEVLQLAERHGVADVVETHPPVSHAEALRRQAEADILLLLLWNNDGEAGVFTSKLFEYLAARRPILCLGREEGVAPDEIRRRGAGAVLKTEAEVRSWLLAMRDKKRAEGGIPPLPEAVGAHIGRAEQFERLEREVLLPLGRPKA